jgi:D-beta-D-heptose 7-phosphate kinase/D-beta-D-heptose 1-phosphate adenosyltransferase
MDLLPIIKRFKGCRVLVVGDLILDCYIWGRVTRISPEAPVPVVDVEENTFALGGAANVAANIVSLGGSATVVGIVGSDRAAQTVEDLAGDKGIDLVPVRDKRPTTVKTRVIAHSQQVVRFDHEDREKVGGKSLRAIIKNIEEAAAGHDAVLVSDYRKGVITTDVMRAILKACGDKFVAVDPKVGHFHLYKGVSLITPNVMEASHGSGVEIRDGGTLDKAGGALISKLGCGAVLLTRGEGGMSLFQDGSIINIPTLARKVYDVTGAGDTVIAAFTLAHAAGASMEEAAVISNHAAGIVVGEVGTASATQARLKQSIKSTKIKVDKKNV